MLNADDILNARILIVDDQESNVQLLEQMLRTSGYTRITSTRDPLAVCDLHRENRYDLILLDLQMPGMDGFQVMEALKTIETDSYVPVLVITAQPAHKLRALESGAKDFISKPLDLIEVKTRINNMLEVRLLYKKIAYSNDMLEETVRERTGQLLTLNMQLSKEVEEHTVAEASLRSAYAENQELKEKFQAENIYLHTVIDKEFNFNEIVGKSNALEYVFFKVEQVAPQDATVLLLGETGTGKGAIARSIHTRSSRKDQPLITVNCSALPANLIESELFGREKGAFTGSSERQMGRFELADKGTLFLDEIGEMPMELQAKLLRVLQDGEFERLGSPKTIKVNVRIIASTNRNLEEEIRSGRFREDLFYRLNVFPITIPPLRQRKDDIPLLVDYFVAKFNKKTGKKIETVPKDTLAILQEYDWPGNVRELESIIERAVITSQGNGLRILDQFKNAARAEEPDAQEQKGLAELERDHILQTLKKTGWRIEGENGAAALLGINPSTLRGRMRKDGIRRSQDQNLDQ